MRVRPVGAAGWPAAQWTEGLHDTEPYPKTQPRQKRWRPESEPDTARLLTRAVRNNLRTGRKILDRLQGRVSAAFGGEGDKPWTSEPGPPTRFNQPISPHRVWDAARFDLADVSEEMRHVKAMNALGAREMTELQEGLPAPTMLLADRAMMPDPAFYAECLRAEFAALAAAGKPTKARRKGSRSQGPSKRPSAIGHSALHL